MSIPFFVLVVVISVPCFVFYSCEFDFYDIEGYKDELVTWTISGVQLFLLVFIVHGNERRIVHGKESDVL
jgi:hypothetical protein